jgi:hypothetical protein
MRATATVIEHARVILKVQKYSKSKSDPAR